MMNIWRMNHDHLKILNFNNLFASECVRDIQTNFLI